MAGKSYDQYCSIAAALDRVGDRWTLLILRELSFGSRRFTDLRQALPGIASNLLTDRLKALEADGLVCQRELPAPAARTVYALTEDGKRIRPVLRALARFGVPLLPDPEEGEVSPRMAVHGTVGPLLESLGSLDLALRFELDGEVHALQFDDGALSRPDRAPDLVIGGSAAALVELCRGAEVGALGSRLLIEGSSAHRRRFAAALAQTASRAAPRQSREATP